MMVRAWLMANMETHDYFSLRDLPKMLRLVIRYRLFRSFFYFLFRTASQRFYRGSCRISLEGASQETLCERGRAHQDVVALNGEGRDSA